MSLGWPRSICSEITQGYNARNTSKLATFTTGSTRFTLVIFTYNIFRMFYSLDFAPETKNTTSRTYTPRQIHEAYFAVRVCMLRWRQSRRGVRQVPRQRHVTTRGAREHGPCVTRQREIFVQCLACEQVKPKEPGTRHLRDKGGGRP